MKKGKFKMEIPPRALRTPKAAAYIGLASHTLENMRSTGDGPRYFKVGRIVMYDVSDLNRWLDKQRTNSLAGSQR